MNDRQSGFILRGVQLYLGIAILTLLVSVTALLAAHLKFQKDAELARVKKAECLRFARQIPDLRESPKGNKLISEDISQLSPGNFVVAYAHPFKGNRWPGDFFKTLAETGGKDRLSILFEVNSVTPNSVIGSSSCFPNDVEIPFSNLFNLFIDPYQQ